MYIIGSWIAFILATLVIGFHLFLLIKYIVLVAKGKNLGAEKVITLSGLTAIISMIFSFILVSFGYDNDVIELELSYNGAYLGIATVLVIPALIFFDLKQNKWIRSLDKSVLKEYQISKEFRTFFIYIVIALTAINLILYGLNFEAFLFQFSGYLGI